MEAPQKAIIFAQKSGDAWMPLCWKCFPTHTASLAGEERSNCTGVRSSPSFESIAEGRRGR